MNTPHQYPRTRLFVESALHAGAGVVLPEKTAHYLVHVLRLREGAALALFNGVDGEWRAEISSAGKRQVDLIVTEKLRPQMPVPEIGLAFAPIKHAALDFMVQKATELGVKNLYPIVTQYTNVGRVNIGRLHDIAIEAAEQSERTDIPAIYPPKPLLEFLASPPPGTLIYGDESGVSAAFRDVFAALPQASLTLLVGPEGGFSPNEHARLKKVATGVCIGPRILRAETAAITMLACAMMEKGDWHAKPAFRAAHG